MALAQLPSFLHSQFFVTPPYPTTDCSGKTIIVTGSNVGLGKEAVRHFVQLGASKVIIAVRSIEKGEAAKKDIEASTNTSNILEVWQLDLQSYESVKEFAQRASGLKRLDAIIENAGKSTFKYESVGGNESTITVNVVSTFLLALLILPTLQRTAREFNVTPNLVIVASEVHFFTSFPERREANIFETLNNPKAARMSDRYNASKLLEVLACREIASQHPVSQLNVVLNFLNPGFCHSELTREITNPIVALFKAILARSTEVGSRTLVHAGLAGSETHGKYLSDAKITACAPLVEGQEGPELQRRVWEELAAKLEEIVPGVTKNLDAK